MNSSATIHNKSDFTGMRKAGQLAAEILDMITEHVKPGVTTETLDTTGSKTHLKLLKAFKLIML